jgi:hypothetical protein
MFDSSDMINDIIEVGGNEQNFFSEHEDNNALFSPTKLEYLDLSKDDEGVA